MVRTPRCALVSSFRVFFRHVPGVRGYAVPAFSRRKAMEPTVFDVVDDYPAYDDADGVRGNSSCAQWTKCSPCIDFYGDDDRSGCLWCNVPKGGGAEGLCLPRQSAQDSCEIGELQVKYSRLAFRACNHFYASTSLPRFLVCRYLSHIPVVST